MNHFKVVDTNVNLTVTVDHKNTVKTSNALQLANSVEKAPNVFEFPAIEQFASVQRTILVILSQNVVPNAMVMSIVQLASLLAFMVFAKTHAMVLVVSVLIANLEA